MGRDYRIIFSFGVNDCVIENDRRRVDPNISLDNLITILDSAKEFYSHILFIGPPPVADIEINTRIEKLHMDFRKACDEISIPYISVFEKLIKNHIWMVETAEKDGSHPGWAGYDLLSQIIHRDEDWWF